MKTKPPAIADLCDAHPDRARPLEPVFLDLGGASAFFGPVATIGCFEDNSKVRDAAGEPGGGRVLVVDGGGSTRRSLVGGDLAAKAAANGWAGIVVFGAVRDALELRAAPIGVRALALCPMKTEKRGLGDRDLAVRVAGETLKPGNWLYADVDGIVVADEPLHPIEGDAR